MRWDNFSMELSGFQKRYDMNIPQYNRQPDSEPMLGMAIFCSDRRERLYSALQGDELSQELRFAGVDSPG
jgi:hypothetical protein